MFCAIIVVMIPSQIKPFLWSYDTSKMDLEKDKNLIIFNILNYGSSKAWAWMFKNYSLREIKNVIKKSYASAWDNKSLNFWSLMLKVKPFKKTRF